MDCDVDTRTLLEIKDRYGLGDQVEYVKRYVRFTRKPIHRQSRISVQQRFLSDDSDHPNFRVLDLSRSYLDKQKCNKPLEISVPQSATPTKVDLSNFMFAISTTLKRLNRPSTIMEWAYWLTNGHGQSNGGKLLLRLLDATDSQIVEIAQRLADAGIDAEVGAWDSRKEQLMALRYFNLVSVLYSHHDSHAKRWLVLCDDDTFFPAMNALLARFEQFDHTKPLYVGTLSEDIRAVRTHGSQAFGGAGVFLSLPLASLISTAHTSCTTKAKIRQANSGWGPQGDILLRKCIYENSGVRLTHLRNIWQLDISGDASGFYESGIQPYSIHHFMGGKVWHTAYPLNTTKIAYTCGEDCLYQRVITTDNFVISNGYSIAQYPQGINFDLDQMERTFDTLGKDDGWNFDYAFGPQRPSLHGTGEKIAWELRDSEQKDDGSVSQIYIRSKDDKRWAVKGKKPMKSLDGIIELVWVAASSDDTDKK